MTDAVSALDDFHQMVFRPSCSSTSDDLSRERDGDEGEEEENEVNEVEFVFGDEHSTNYDLVRSDAGGQHITTQMITGDDAILKLKTMVAEVGAVCQLTVDACIDLLRRCKWVVANALEKATELDHLTANSSTIVFLRIPAECPNCGDSAECVVLSCCGYWSCGGCLVKYLEHCNGFTAVSARCPQGMVDERNCANGRLGVCVMRELGAAEGERRLWERCMTTFLRESPYHRRCPSCSAIHESCVSYTLSTSSPCLPVHCDCGIEFCFTCLEPVNHAPAACAAHQRWIVESAAIGAIVDAEQARLEAEQRREAAAKLTRRDQTVPTLRGTYMEGRRVQPHDLFPLQLRVLLAVLASRLAPFKIDMRRRCWHAPPSWTPCDNWAFSGAPSQSTSPSI